MRITAGSLKGRRVSGPVGRARPTSAKVREAIFNIIGGRISESRFLDLYAGTGAVGMEAMSRGAECVFFVESEKRTADALQELLSGCGCRSRANIVKSDASSFINKCLKKGIKFDIVFLDPPYASEELREVLPVLGEGEILEDDCVVIAEHSRKLELPSVMGAIKAVKTYRYGDTMLTLYRRKE